MQAAFDRRRINGPEKSRSPTFDDENEAGETGFTNKSKLRDGRGATDMRPLCEYLASLSAATAHFTSDLRTGLTSQANGSAYIETGKTKIACAVYGPRQSKSGTYSERGNLNVEIKLAPFSCRHRKVPNRDVENRFMAMAIHQALLPSVRLELFPKSNVDVFITVLESDGLENRVSASIIAASTALVAAGIEMLALVVSCSAIITPGGDIWTDATVAESLDSRGSLNVACMPALSSVTSVSQKGDMTTEQLLQCMELCETRCVDIHAIVVQCLRDSTA